MDASCCSPEERLTRQQCHCGCFRAMTGLTPHVFLTVADAWRWSGSCQ